VPSTKDCTTWLEQRQISKTFQDGQAVARLLE
jgi:hypothetical protein